MREAEVTDAAPQNSCATQAMTSMNSAHLSLVAVCQMYCTSKAPAPSVPCTSGTANVTATSRMNPNTTETTTDMMMPSAAPRAAPLVSSLRCAEASKPVIVYCAISSPIPKTNQNTGCEKSTPEKPDVLRVFVNTNEAD